MSAFDDAFNNNGFWYRLRKKRIMDRNFNRKLLFQILASLYILGALIIAFRTFYRSNYTSQKEDSLIYQNKVVQMQKNLLKTFDKQLSELKKAEALISRSKDTTATLQLFKKVDSITFRLNEVQKFNIALRQAINPLKPDEVLTIARLQDEIKYLTKTNKDLEIKLESKEKSFEDSVKRELDASSKGFYAVIAILIPLAFNFLYTIWKDKRNVISSKLNQ